MKIISLPRTCLLSPRQGLRNWSLASNSCLFSSKAVPYRLKDMRVYNNVNKPFFKDNSLNNFINLSAWKTREIPSITQLNGSYCRLVSTKIEHSKALYNSFECNHNKNWEWLPHEKPSSEIEHCNWMSSILSREGTYFYTVMNENNRPVGISSYLRVDNYNGSIEVGNIHYSDEIKMSAISTEAIFLMLSHVFDDLGYRRCEWKCDSNNIPSIKSAERLGFTFEGIFRQHLIVKGKNRDTSWFSIIDKDWVKLKPAFQQWLSADNFNEDGGQINRLNCKVDRQI